MADLGNCKKYDSCNWRASVGYCPENCNHFKHRDEVIVVRCKDCVHYKPQRQSAHWTNVTLYCCRGPSVKVSPGDFCSFGERRDNG